MLCISRASYLDQKISYLNCKQIADITEQKNQINMLIKLIGDK